MQAWVRDALRADGRTIPVLACHQMMGKLLFILQRPPVRAARGLLGLLSKGNLKRNGGPLSHMHRENAWRCVSSSVRAPTLT
eukprot:4690670-Prorocentrum_lima.AAC.1